MKINTQIIQTIVFTILLFLSLKSNAQSGILDLSFDSDGKVTTDINNDYEIGKSVAIQTDGKIVVAGYSHDFTDNFAIVRYNPDGSLDNSFDLDGKVITDFGNTNNATDKANAVVIQSDGKILAAGYSYNSINNTYYFALARYNINGSLDLTFDTDGKVLTNFGLYNQSSNSIIIQTDGKILVAGYSYNANNSEFALARYNVNGSLDLTFDIDGKVTTDFGIGNDQGNSIAIQSDGKIIVAGTSEDATSNKNFALARYNSNGSLDISFDIDGKVLTDFNNGNDYGNSIAVQSDGKIIVAGTNIDLTSGGDLALARYNSNGSLDNTFDSDGKVTTDLGYYGDEGSSIAIQSDGKIVVAGRSGYFTFFDFALVRYNLDGSLDNTFDTDGKVITDFGDLDIGNSVAIQSDGKIVVAGSNFDPTNSNDNIAIARYSNSINIQLPISLLFFMGQNNLNTNELYWRVTNPTNFSHFEIERSIDGIKFTKIGSVQSLGIDNEINDYSFRDANLVSTQYYYRIKFVDIDEYYTFSKIIFLHNESNSEMKIYPNPFTTFATFYFKQPLTNATIIVYNSLGQIVNKTNNQNGSMVTFKRENLLNGLYYIEIKQNNEIIMKNKLIIFD